jgi:hypothetical protein
MMRKVEKKDMATVGQVGLGHWGPKVLRNLMSLPSSRVKVCCGLDLQALDRVRAAYPELLMTGDYDQLPDDAELDAIVVTGPAGAHFTLARTATEQRKYVFVEKPSARCYVELLAEIEKVTPYGQGGLRHFYRQDTTHVPRCDESRAYRKEQGIGTMIYNPGPLHRLPSYADLGYSEGNLPDSEQAAQQVLPLPIYQELGQAGIPMIVQEVAAFHEGA